MNFPQAMADSDALASLLPNQRHNSPEPPPTIGLSISAKEWHPTTAVPAKSWTQTQPSASTQLRADAAGFTPASSPAQDALDHRLPPEHLSNWQNDGWENDDGSGCDSDQVIGCNSHYAFGQELSYGGADDR